MQGKLPTTCATAPVPECKQFYSIFLDMEIEDFEIPAYLFLSSC